GGTGYNGPTQCETGATCQVQDSTFSICLPNQTSPSPSSSPRTSPRVSPSPSPSPQSSNCAAAWGQCGGQGWNGPTCCVSGNTCTKSDNYYSQCKPGSSSGGNNGGNNGSCAAKYAQCGGNGFSGPTCCQSGSSCQKSNDYYSQCL
ncbi:hypothetical protein HK098_002412, partial [Nowakowskiella sp. JEL0407]